MPNGFCASLIRSTNRNLLVAALLLAVGPVLFFGYFHRYFTGYVQPIQTLDIADISAMTAGAAADRFVRIAADQVAPSGIDEIHSPDKADRATYREGTYLLASASGRTMLVYVGQGTPAARGRTRTFEGVLVPLNERHQLRTLADGTADRDLGKMAPVFLDTDHYRRFGRVSFFFGGALLLLSISMFGLWLWRATSAAHHPFVRRLAAYGDAQALVAALDADMAADHVVVQFSSRRAEGHHSGQVLPFPFHPLRCPYVPPTPHRVCRRRLPRHVAWRPPGAHLSRRRGQRGIWGSGLAFPIVENHPSHCDRALKLDLRWKPWKGAAAIMSLVHSAKINRHESFHLPQ